MILRVTVTGVSHRMLFIEARGALSPTIDFGSEEVSEGGELEVGSLHATLYENVLRSLIVGIGELDKSDI